MRLLSGNMAAACLFLSMGIAASGEVPIDLTAKAPLIYKSEETGASVEPDASGTGVRLNYDFENGGNTARFDFLSPPLEGPISKLTITAKGSEGPLFLIVRDAASKPVGYEVGPITADEQTFTVDLASPSSIAGRQNNHRVSDKGDLFHEKRNRRTQKGLSRFPKSQRSKRIERRLVGWGFQPRGPGLYGRLASITAEVKAQRSAVRWEARLGRLVASS